MNRVMHIATAVATCALWAACAAEPPAFEEEAGDSIGESQAGLEVQTDTCAPPDPTFLCDGRVWVHEGLRSVALPFCAADDLEPVDALGNPKAPLPHTRLLIAQHGRGSDGGYYQDLFEDVTDLAEDAHLTRGETLVVAPQFLQPKYICSKGVPNEQLDDILIWSEGGVQHDWAIGGLSSKPGEPIERSSYAMIERLLDKARARMPNLREIVFAGQSAGGQLVQRFALLNDYDFEGVQVRYAPANPMTVTFPTADRLEVDGSGFDLPTPGVYFADSVCDLNDDCTGSYDDYFYGLQNVPDGHYADTGLSAAQIESRYADRDVTYVLGETDITHDLNDCGCANQLEGKNRRHRSENLSRYMRDIAGAASHEAVRVPDHGHGGTVFKQRCGYAALFGAAWACDATTDHSVNGGLAGTVVATTFGNVDDDDAEEVAVIEQVGRFTTRVRVYDDLEHGYALLFEPTEGWSWLQRARSIAFGDVNGDGKDELAVGRSSTSGDTWFLYATALNGTWFQLDSGGAALDSPRTINAVAFGDMDDDGNEELAVTRNATSGTRWLVYSMIGAWPNMMQPTHMGGETWPQGTRPTDLSFGDTDLGDGEELVVINDAQSGTRGWVYTFFGNGQLENPFGAGWSQGNVLQQVATGDVDRDGKDEIVIGREGIGAFSRWFVMEGATQNHVVVLHGGFDATPEWNGATLTSLDVGVIDMRGRYPAMAVTANTPGGALLEAITFHVQKDGDLQAGDISRPNLGLAEARSVALGDVDGLGGDEILLGIGNSSQVGYGLRVLPAP